MKTIPVRIVVAMTKYRIQMWTRRTVIRRRKMQMEAFVAIEAKA